MNTPRSNQFAATPLFALARLAGLTGFLLTGLAALACTAQVRQTAFEAHYSSSSSRISVDGSNLTVVRLEHEYDNPVSALPSRTEAITKTVVLAP